MAKKTLETNLIGTLVRLHNAETFPLLGAPGDFPGFPKAYQGRQGEIVAAWVDEGAPTYSVVVHGTSWDGAPLFEKVYPSWFSVLEVNWRKNRQSQGGA